MTTLWQDLRYGARMMLKDRGFTLIVVLTLAIGIGANTAIFSIVNAVMLHALPFQDPERIVLLWQTSPKSNFTPLPFSFPNFTDVKEQSQSFEQTGAWSSYSDTRFNLAGEPAPEKIQAALVSANFFSILGVQPMLGRTFLEEEDKEGGPRAVVVSYGLWQRRFGSDPNLLGKTLTLDGNGYTVIGIMPRSFAFPKFPRAADVWTALSRDPDPTQFRKYARGATFLNVFARLKPGVKPEQAQAEMETISRRLEKENPRFNTGLAVKLVLLSRQVIGDLKRGLLILLGAVVCVLLIACANVANLSLARASTRQQEIAIRIAMGARRSRIIRQLLTESILLSLTGGALGLLFALWGIDLLASMPYYSTSPFVPYSIAADQISLNGEVLCFTLALSLLTGVIFGLAPALQASKTDLNQSLKEGGTSSTGRRRHRVRSFLLVAEIAVSLILLIGAGLLMKSFMRLLEVDPGFKPESVLTAEINLPRSSYSRDSQIAAFYQQVLERIKTLPGVHSVGAVSALPLTGTDSGSDFFIEGQAPPTPDKENEAHYRSISPDYFAAMGVPVVEGRSFTESDSKDAQRTAIINESMARRFWPGQNPIGKRLALSIEALKFPEPNRPPVFDIPGAMREIVGVVKDMRHYGLNSEALPELYLPCSQFPSREMTIVVRTDADPLSIADAVRRETLNSDKNQPVTNVKTMSNLLSESVAKPRFNFLLMSLFAATALLLAAVGVYGVMSFSVTQRTREIGIRVALGARPSDIFRLVVGQGILIALIGAAIGLAGAFALTRLMSSLLFGVSATDPATFVFISLLLIVVTFAACYLPARRATKTDPMIALRCE